MTTTFRRPTLLAMALAAILIFAILPVAGQTDDATDEVRLERTLSTAHALPGSTFRVCLKIEALTDLDGVGIHEQLPLGWEVHPVDAQGAAFKRDSVQWVFPDRVAEGTTLKMVYEVTVPDGDKLYATTLPTCFEITGILQSTVPGFDTVIPGDAKVEIVTALPIPTAIAHLVIGTDGEPDTIDLRLDQTISGRQLDRALTYWATDSVVPWTEGEIVDLAMIEKLTAHHETCTDVDQPLPLSLDPALVAVRSIDTFLPCDTVLLPDGVLDPGVQARQLSVAIDITGSHDAYGIGLKEWFPSSWRVTPVEHPGFVYRPSAREWVFPGRLKAGETISVRYVVEMVDSIIDDLSLFDGCCGAPAPLAGVVSSGLECSIADVVGESEAFVWECLPVLLAISRWDIAYDDLDVTLSDAISFQQMQRAMAFWLENAPVPYTCGYTIGYHMMKRIIAYWLSGVPVTKPLPGEVLPPCLETDGCYVPNCVDGGLCHLLELQRVEDYVGGP